MEDKIPLTSGRLTEQAVISPKVTTQIKRFTNFQAREEEGNFIDQSRPLGNHNRNQGAAIKQQAGGSSSKQRSSSVGSNQDFIKKISNPSAEKGKMDEQLKKIIDVNTNPRRESGNFSERKSATAANGINLNQSMEKVDLTYLKVEDMRLIFKENWSELMDNLVDLNLSYMNLNFVPMEALELKQLLYLKLDYNNIKLLPERMVEFERLEYLSVSNNCLEALPRNFNKMKALKCLNLGKNMLSRIGSELTHLKSLEVLYIYANPFTKLPLDFPCLSCLKEFALEWFKYTDPPLNPIMRKPASNAHFDKMLELWDKLRAMQAESVGFTQFISYFSTGELDFNRLDAKARTLLHIAGMEDELGVVGALSEEQPHLINKLDKDGHSALTLCLLDGRLRSSSILLNMNADPNMGGSHYGSALHLAITKHLVDFVNRFLKMGCNPNSFDYEGNTPLHLIFSIFAKDEEKSKAIAEALLKYGANTRIKNKELHAPVHLAVKRNQRHAIAFAIAHNLKKSRELVVEQKENKTLFDLNQRGGKYKWTPLHFACNQGNMEIIQMLTDYKRIDLFSESAQRQYPRDVAFPSLLLLKTIRKQEEIWIKKNIIRKGSQRAQKRGELLNLNAMIDKTMKKKETVFEEGSKDLAEHSRKQGRCGMGLDLHISAQGMLAKYFSNNPNNESVLDPDIQEVEDLEFGNVDEFCVNSKNAANNKSKLDQSSRRDTGSKGKNNVLVSSLEGHQNNIGALDKRVSETQVSIREKEFHGVSDLVENNSFIQDHLINKTIGSLDLNSFLKETERLEHISTKMTLAFSERVKALIFLMLLHYKFADKIKKFQGNALPLSFFIVNEFLKFEKYYTKFNRCDVLLKSLERVLMFYAGRLEPMQNCEAGGLPEQGLSQNKEWLIIILIANYFVDVNHWRFLPRIQEIFADESFWSKELSQIRRVVLYNVHLASLEIHRKNSLNSLYTGRSRSRSISYKKEGGSSMRDLSLDSKTAQSNKLKINRSFNDLIGGVDSKNTSTDYEDRKDNSGKASARPGSQPQDNGTLSERKGKAPELSGSKNISARENANQAAYGAAPQFQNNVLSKKDIQTKRISKVNALDKTGKIRAEIIKGERLDQDDELPIHAPKKNELFLKNKRKDFAPMIDPSSVIYSRGPGASNK